MEAPKLENEGIKVFPQSKVIKIIKKNVFKRVFQKNKIPTSSFNTYKNIDQIKKDLSVKNKISFHMGLFRI